MKKTLAGIFALFMLIFGNSIFALEKSVGIDLGEKIELQDGTLYNAHSFSVNFDVAWESFGIKPFFAFSFSKSQHSNMPKEVVNYNYQVDSYAEIFGVKHYFIFRKAEKSSSYLGLLFSLNFCQTSRETFKVLIEGTDRKSNYVSGELGFFVGNKWNVNEHITIFAECDFASRLFAKTTTYEIAGESVDDYHSAMLGGGGTNSWMLFITPRLGASWKL